MMCLVWALAVAVLVKVGDVNGQCWEQANCQDLSSETNILECIKLCRSDLNSETPIFPGEAHLQPPPSSDDPASLPPALSPSPPGSSSELPSENQIAGSQAKRSYSMGHFRWGKPVGRKRRPIKVYTNGVEEESAEVSPNEMRRDVDNAVAEEGAGAGGAPYNLQEKKDGSYKMNHFRWSAPPASKRYGGFMKSWDERSQTPLLTLFKNVINKDVQQQ